MFLAILKGSSVIGFLVLVLGLVAIATDSPVNLRYTMDGAAHQISGFFGLILIAALFTLAGCLVIALIGLPLWFVASSVFSTHWLVAACIGPFLAIIFFGFLGRSGVPINLAGIAAITVLALIAGLMVWRSAYRETKSVADLF